MGVGIQTGPSISRTMARGPTNSDSDSMLWFEDFPFSRWDCWTHWSRFPTTPKSKGCGSNKTTTQLELRARMKEESRVASDKTQIREYRRIELDLRNTTPEKIQTKRPEEGPPCTEIEWLRFEQDDDRIGVCAYEGNAYRCSLSSKREKVQNDDDRT